MMTSTKTINYVIGLMCASALILGGCSSSDSENPEPPDSANSTTTEPSESSQTQEPSPPSTPPGNSDASDPTESEDSPSETSPPETSRGDSPTEIPTGAVDYADVLVIAWGSGDSNRMTRLATDDVIQTLHKYGAAGGPHWDQTEHDAGAGSVFVAYENTDDGTTLELRVQNEAANSGEEHAVVEAKLSEH